MQALGKPTDKPNLVCGPVQVVLAQVLPSYWEVEKREIPMEPNKFQMDPATDAGARSTRTRSASCRRSVSPIPAHYELVPPLAEALDKLHKENGIDVDIHVDAASGGFLAPFCAPEIAWDFRLPRVKSISTSGHKYRPRPARGRLGHLARPGGSLGRAGLLRALSRRRQSARSQINFSRPAGQVIAQYYLLNRLGREGYSRVQGACYDTAQWLSKQIAGLGPFEFINTGDPKTGLPAVCFKVKDGAKLPYTLYDLSAKLLQRGWQVPAFALSGGASDITIMRVMIRQGVSRDMAALLVEDMQRAVAGFEKHPVSVPLTEEELGSYTHN